MSSSQALILLLTAIAALVKVSGAEVLVGVLPNEQHGIGGNLYVVDSRTLRFEEFDYDGGGPGAFLYYYAPGQSVSASGGGVVIPLPSQVGKSDGSFQQRRFNNEDFTVTLPAGTDVCDIGTLTIWCQPFRAIFTRIVFLRSLFDNNGADPCTLSTPAPPTTMTIPTTIPPPVTTLPPPTTTIAPPVPQEILIGVLPNEQHGIGGNLYVVDSRTLRFEDFDYDGRGPGAFLYYYAPGRSVTASGGGVIIPLPNQVGQSDGSFQERPFINEDFTVTLPAGTDVCDIGTLTIWCQPFRAIFTRIVFLRSLFDNNGADPCTLSTPAPPTTMKIPTTMPPPLTTLPPPVRQEILIGVLPNEQHGIGGNLYVVDSRTLRFEDFDYDGRGPGAFLYYYAPGRSVTASGGGVIIPLPNQVGQSDGSFQERPFINEDFTVTLPAGTDVCDIGTLTIWCQPFRAIFTRIVFLRSLFVNNGADPCTLVVNTMPTPLVTTEVSTEEQTTTSLPPRGFDNCIPLHETMQLSWYVDSDNFKARFKLCGCQSIEPNTNQYLGFGLSGSPSRTLMVGADPIITWVDSITGQPQAVDYYLSAYTQCRAGSGACPDTLIGDRSCSNNVFDVSGSVENGEQCISFSRPLVATDACDGAIDPTNQNQYIVWGIGGLGETAFKHFARAEGSDPPIHLGRPPQDQCAGVELTCRGCAPFVNRHIIAKEDTVFELKIGPSGNERGYQAITGQVGWGIAWYINNTLTPELTVMRGRQYTFLIRGGDNDERLSLYHPFYITNSRGGGRLQNTDAERANEVVYAGIDENEQPTGVGPLCQMEDTPASFEILSECRDLDTYINSLRPNPNSVCTGGQPGKLVWTPDEDTPDVVYYQCATHLNLGWRINVINPACPSRAPSNLPRETLVNALVVTLEDTSSLEFISLEDSFRAAVESIINSHNGNGIQDACVTVIGLTDSDDGVVVRFYVSSQGSVLEAKLGVSALMAGIQDGAFEDAGFDRQVSEVKSDDEFESSGLSGPAIVGIVFGAIGLLLILLLAVVVILVIVIKTKRNSYKHHSTTKEGFDNKVYYYTNQTNKDPLDESVKF